MTNIILLEVIALLDSNYFMLLGDVVNVYLS